MATSANKSLEMIIGGLLEATQNMQRDITEIRRDIKDSDSRAALSYEQSEQRAAASRSKMYAKTDELVDRVAATEAAVSKLNDDMTGVKAVTAEVTRWKLMGLGALGVTGMAAAALASLITAYWCDKEVSMEKKFAEMSWHPAPRFFGGGEATPVAQVAVAEGTSSLVLYDDRIRITPMWT
ncbi:MULTISPECIES: DUF1515 family protein [unclassified Mesorhizobium]|uniref:DUF1515 family protein n=2 Tax=unclassified Mesorhizobium TaxID=325217 RepID=UPI000FD1ECC4|nr:MULTISPECIES: DUF1515 family protein [unclassified Mesorhizobium]RVA04263.1 DUF1515 domain-containing protein [Mesorhizobium sp. M7A.F.Ca.US.002.01.1.1]RVA04801.1 DUF1515 domain-containing protein [Mesorhizobium sp. M7A.F.Ca.US.001.02.1.1]RVA30803.1 DUF1515 domain-containing protein [Mesorhizobium sp. M7A.F.Ca.US.001.01.1.1]